MQLSLLQQQLINDHQQGFPLCSAPFSELAQQYKVDECEVLAAINSLQTLDVLSRLGPVFDHKKAGASTLVAMAVAEDKLDHIADLVNQFEQVNHNYAREHDYNLWFVVTDKDMVALNKTLKAIEEKTALTLLILPMEASYHIDLSFKIDFNDNPQEQHQLKHKEALR
ncbi:MAG: AsnC family protein [Gammaproteobacteria bacterium]|nr:MAG: AsnC family protein [Gammaproteobacteria bacterium]